MKTRPARISAGARLRLSASPRSTSSWSARTPLAIGWKSGGAGAAAAAHLDDRASGEESGRLGGGPHAIGDAIVVEMGDLAAIVANQKDAVVDAVRMLIGDIGVGALDPMGEVGRHEQVENAVDAVRRDPAFLAPRHRFGNVIGRGWTVEG